MNLEENRTSIWEDMEGGKGRRKSFYNLKK